MLLTTLKNWFSARLAQSATRPRPATTLRVESLDGRVMPAALTGLPNLGAIVQ